MNVFLYIIAIWCITGYVTLFLSGIIKGVEKAGFVFFLSVNYMVIAGARLAKLISKKEIKIENNNN